MSHPTTADLEAKLGWLADAPTDGGRITGIAIRPETNKRVLVSECEVSPEQGVHGDNWARRSHGAPPNLGEQIAIMSSRMIELLADTRDDQALSGDQFFADLDLSTVNLHVGQQLSIGTAILKITPAPHLGCVKFSNHYGPDALRFVNSEAGNALRLRGVYAQVISPGTIEVGSTINKI